jgi:hypothetical protein
VLGPEPQCSTDVTGILAICYGVRPSFRLPSRERYPCRPPLVIFTLGLATAAMAADPFVGTWKLIGAKSEYSPGPAPKSGTQTITAQDNGLEIVIDSVDAAGKPSHQELNAILDGKDHPVTGNPDVDAYSATRVDANTYTVASKKNGKEVVSYKRAASKDGKTMTINVKGKNVQGQDIYNTTVWDRQ